MTTLLLVRHGQSVANLETRFVGHIDADLTDTGMLQAKETAKFIAENYKVSKVYASDLKRAYKTGKAVSDLLGVEIIGNKNLREIYAGNWEGNKFDDLAVIYKEQYGLWLSDIGKAAPENGETVKELGDRIYAELNEIATQNDGKTIVIATHATPVRVMQSLVQTGSLDGMKNIPWVSNASVTELFFDNGLFHFGKISQDNHLGDLKTYFAKNVKV
ncbi:MAG: histidine phosphatase family protein [Clostridia bacterium]|nr:histidine phosphatase family protein [Clostridia bacterium]